MTKARDLANIIATGVPNSLITLDAAEIPNLDASKITTGALGTARIPNLSATKITSDTFTDARIAASNVTQHATDYDDNKVATNIALLGFKTALNGSLAKYNLQDQIIDEFVDNSGIDTGASTNETLGGSGTNKYFSGSATSPGSTVTTAYTYDGSDDTIALANGEILNGSVEIWGAAGGSDSSGSGKYGGGGGYIKGTISYPSDGTDVIVSVGQGGPMGTESGAGGSGGGYSGLFAGSKAFANSLIIAGGGGGAGDGQNGGQGGSTTGGNGGGSNAGQGGTQSAGGTVSGTSSVWNPTAGSALQGGVGGNSRPGKSTGTTAFNGGGYQGGEPGGQVGGGGGGGGYYGAGGGNNAGDGAGGGGGSNYFNASYLSTVTNAGGNTQTTLSAGHAYTTNEPSATIGDAGTSTAGNGGAVWISYSIDTLSYNNLTLQSLDTTASTANPDYADMVILAEDGAGTATLNTDIKGYVSEDSGVTFTQGTLVDEGSWGTNKKILAFHDLDISAQTGSAMCYKITTHNQSVSKITNIHAVALGWK